MTFSRRFWCKFHEIYKKGSLTLNQTTDKRGLTLNLAEKHHSFDKSIHYVLKGKYNQRLISSYYAIINS